MQWSDIPIRPPQRTLRQFAGLWTVVFGLIALWQGLMKENTTLAVVFGVLAVTIGLPGLVRPQTIRWGFVAAMVLTFPIGWLVSRIILGVLFYGLFTPISLLFRVLGRDALSLKRKPNADTYWEPKVLPTDVRRYARQF